METDKEKNKFRKDWYNKGDNPHQEIRSIVEKIEDNPVPSLDDLVEIFMAEVIPEGELSDKKMNLVYNYLEKFVDYVKYQNGVETNKEQLQECSLCIPKCEGCTQDEYDQAYTDAIDRGAIQ